MPKRKPTAHERYETRRILFDGKHDGSARIYDRDFHPEDIVRYFTERYEQLEDPERYATEHRLTYVEKPVRPPSLAGYAATIGVGRETLWSWRKKYDAFAEAVDACKAMQEAMIVELTATGAYNAGFAALMMKNFHDWQDKVEQTHKGGVTLNFDAQDEEA